MVVYHHNDMDGKSAAYCVHTYKPREIPDNASSYVMMTYEDEFDKHTIKDDVFIVDLSISKNTYSKLLEVCKTARTVTWIDHHESSVDIVNEHKDELQAIHNLTYFISKCACGAALTYAYLHIPSKELLEIRKTEENEYYEINARYKDDGIIRVFAMKKDKKDPTDAFWYTYDFKLPKWLFHIDDYDCWKQIDPDTEFFMLGTDSTNTAFTKYDKRIESRVFNNFWDNLTKCNDNIILKYISIGKNISNYIHSKYMRELRHTFEWEYEGTTFICKNDTCPNSYCFEYLLDKYPAAIRFYYSAASGKWMYSCYASEQSDFNCKEFCEKFGGGGHAKAAGFSTEKLIFTEKINTKHEPLIFLGGTCNGDEWRTEFIHHWKKNEDIKKSKIKLFNPIVEDWTEEDKKREDEAKEKALINLFVITPKMIGTFSIAEAVECVNNFSSKTIFIIYNKHNDPAFNKAIMKSFDAVGEIITKHGGIYASISGENGMEEIVNTVISVI